MAAVTRTTYFVIFSLLMILLFVTVAIAYFPLGMWAAPVAMTIATIKAVLIVMYFMHVKYEVALVKILSVSGFLWLGILFALLVSDYRTRFDVEPLEPFPAIPQQVHPAPAH